MSDLKVCQVCKIEKPKDAFSKTRGKKDGLSPKCKACHHDYYARNAETVKARVTRRAHVKSDEIKEYQKSYRGKHREKLSQYSKERWLQKPEDRKRSNLRKYNLSYEDYMSMLESQNGVCCICKQPERVQNKAGKVFDLSVDHCHTTGKVRGLLCRKCNSVIGYCFEDKSILLSAVKYLERFEHVD